MRKENLRPDSYNDTLMKKAPGFAAALSISQDMVQELPFREGKKESEQQYNIAFTTLKGKAQKRMGIGTISVSRHQPSPKRLCPEGALEHEPSFWLAGVAGTSVLFVAQPSFTNESP